MRSFRGRRRPPFRGVGKLAPPFPLSLGFSFPGLALAPAPAPGTPALTRSHQAEDSFSASGTPRGRVERRSVRLRVATCLGGRRAASQTLGLALSLSLLNPFPGQGHGLSAQAGPGAAPGHAEAAASLLRGPAQGTGCRALLGPEGSAASGPRRDGERWRDWAQVGRLKAQGLIPCPPLTVLGCFILKGVNSTQVSRWVRWDFITLGFAGLSCADGRCDGLLVGSR